jgi:hypothetical protein
MPSCESCGLENTSTDCTCKGIKMDEWTPLIIQSMNSKFGHKAEKLYALLQETGSLISGGSILSACIGQENKKQDIDIYVPVKHIPRFLNDMVLAKDRIFAASLWRKFAASFYCSSFLRKNGIRKIYTFATDSNTLTKDYAEMDIMAVRNSRGPLAVVNNFDLTFCQVWFDGKDVYASHPDHIKNMSGELQSDYCMTLLSGNKFLRNRISKYIDRGFKINFSKEFNLPPEINKNYIIHFYNQASQECKTPIEGIDRLYKFNDEDYATRWYNRIAMRYFLGVRDDKDANTKEPILIIPLKHEFYNSQYTFLNTENYKINRSKGIPYVASADTFRINQGNPSNIDDGYDSDDMNDDELRKIAVTHYKGNADSDDLRYYRQCTNLVINTHIYDTQNLGSITLSFLSSMDTKNNKFIMIIEDKSLRKGEDLFGNEGKLYDIHEHDEMGATTSASLEQYLRGTMSGDDYEPKCYYSGNGCTKKLVKNEIRAIVSKEFYDEFFAPRPVKTGLNTEVGFYETVFRNNKSLDPAWGNIYHATMCPFCLKFEERDNGCSYMTHANPNDLSLTESPYCPNERGVSEIIGKYKNAAARLEGDGYGIHLEFCVECGRPCSGHQHFKLDMSGMIPTKQIVNPRNPAQMIYDYGTCPGGGRPELIARMMAVRNVYRRRNLKDIKEERLVAALAADAAPLNEELMKKATDLWELALKRIEWNRGKKLAISNAIKEAGNSDEDQKKARLEASNAFNTENPMPPDVDWDTVVPKTKAYNDELYEGVENDENPDAWIDKPSTEGGVRSNYKRRRYNCEFHKHAYSNNKKLTRKNSNKVHVHLTYKKRKESGRSELKRSKTKRMTRRVAIKERRRFTR